MNKTKKIFCGFCLIILSFGQLFAELGHKSVSDTIPDFYANTQHGELWHLQDNLDKTYLVVYFYPAAMTGGCTKQACAYRDDLSLFNQLDAKVVGISGDPVYNLKAFSQMHALNFELLSDVNGEIAELFGLPLRKGGSITRTLNNKEILLTRAYTSARWTFILNQNREIIHINQDVKAVDDSQDVIRFLKANNKP